MSELIAICIISFGCGFFVAVAFCRSLKNSSERLLRQSKELNEETRQMQAGMMAQKQRLLMRFVDKDGEPVVELSKN